MSIGITGMILSAMRTPPQNWLFPKSIAEAKLAQKEMAESVCLQDDLSLDIQTIAGVDVSNTRFDPLQRVFGAIALLQYPSLNVEETAGHVVQEAFPYVPGLLGFREVPALLRAYERLQRRPDLIFVDGHGISHPRGLGIATHLGILLDIPTIGVAKSILVGQPAQSLAEEAGSRTSLQWQGKEIGMCLRTKKRCNPLIISAGHKISLHTAIEWVLRCLQGYRLPEPTRQAHIAANAYRKTVDLKPV